MDHRIAILEPASSTVLSVCFACTYGLRVLQVDCGVKHKIEFAKLCYRPRDHEIALLTDTLNILKVW